MCGISGIIAKNHQMLDSSLIEKMNAALYHRGPDHQDYFLRQNLAFGFTRLSIVDLQNGNQPFFNEDQSLTLICNGEIYNYAQLRTELLNKGHIFRSNSDCEVIVHLYEDYGIDCVGKLEGMFAFALFDSKKNALLLGRDRTGIKPLFYAYNSDWFVFASEIKGILASGLFPRELDAQSIKAAFTFGYIPGEETVIKSVRHLPPASMIIFDLNTNAFRIDEYWQPTFLEASNQGKILGGQYAEGLALAVEKAVKSHLIGDVPMSAYLSGGIDSTVVTTLLSIAKVSNLTSFSIKFTDKLFDESEVFNQTIKQLGVQSKVLEMKGASLADFKRAITAIEQPQFSPMDVPMNELSKLVNHHGRKVVLVGEGSDELFGGYNFFALNQANRALSIPSLQNFKIPMLERVVKSLIGSGEFSSRILAIYSEDNQPVIDQFGTYPAWYPLWKVINGVRANLFGDPENTVLKDKCPMINIADKLKSNFKQISEFDKSIYLELKSRLPNYILARADRNSMANSVELRLPFLDNSVIDYALLVPNLFKMLGFKEKYVLRRAFKKILPKHVANRKKFGYNSPNRWLWNNPSEETLSFLSEEAILKSGIFNPEIITAKTKRLMSGFVLPETYEHEEIMQELTGVLSVQILHQEFCS